MENDKLLPKIKLSLRIRNSKAFDDDIMDHIESAKADMLLAGINVEKDDALIHQAIKHYCRANFALDNADSVKFSMAYDSLKDKLSLCEEYKL